MKYLKRFYVMLQFLTTIPMKKQIVLGDEEFGKGLAMAPIVGLIVGSILFGTYELISPYMSQHLISLTILMLYVILTGGLHIDGLADTFDAVFSRRSREKMLEIMKDSRIGTMGVLAMIFLIAFDYILLDHFVERSATNSNFALTFILFPVAGRIGSVTCVSLHKYARKEGMAKSFTDYCTKKELLLSILYAMVICTLIIGKFGVVYSLLSFVGAVIISAYFARKLDGITGDIAGAVCELTQLVFLFSVYFCEKFGGSI